MIIEKRVTGFFNKDQKIKDPEILEYCKKLVIPPAYKDVRIYYSKTRKYKILFTGVDSKGRTQYIYQKWWSDKARSDKHFNILEYGSKILEIEKHTRNVLDRKENKTDDQIHEYLCCLILKIMMLSNFRIGNEKYKKLYSSYGITTIECRHIRIGKTMKIEFIGKKGVVNTSIIDNPEIIKHVSRLMKGKKPTENLFEIKQNGKVMTVDNLDINRFLLKFGNITSKMIRIWNANIILLEKMAVESSKMTISERKKHINEAIKEISATIHNTPAICKKEYLNNDLIELFINHPVKTKKITSDKTATDQLLKFLSY